MDRFDRRLEVSLDTVSRKNCEFPGPNLRSESKRYKAIRFNSLYLNLRRLLTTRPEEECTSRDGKHSQGV